jgi:hypothetical protein
MLCWIQAPRVPSVAKSLGEIGSNTFFHIATNWNLNFTPIACTLTINVNFIWDDFINFYTIFFPNETLETLKQL